MNRHEQLWQVTDRIKNRSTETRARYIQRIDAAVKESRDRPRRSGLGCTNLAHGYAAAPSADKIRLRQLEPNGASANIAIVSAYNEMLSAHQPLGDYPPLIKKVLAERQCTAQFAGGVPAMCDGVTQGMPGMELSLFSRDVIAMSSAIALSHDMFDGALYLGVCDKIVPGLLMSALSFGHMPAIFVPAGPMPSGISNNEKARVRQLFAEGKVTEAVLLESEEASYHSPGTCTFYGTANSNQMLMEIMGLHIPGAAFIQPGTELRDALTSAAAVRISEITGLTSSFQPLGRMIDERSIVNAIVGLLATGGSTNHTLHLVAIARAAGIVINWDDFAELSSFVPLLTRIYPNGEADVNQFHQAGGLALVISELLEAGLLHADVETVMGQGLDHYAQQPTFNLEQILKWHPVAADSRDPAIISTMNAPFSEDGGLKLLTGNLGRAVVKTSALKDPGRVIEAPVEVFHSQQQLLDAFEQGMLEKNFIAVVRYQGPKANGMPELHSLTPVLGALQDKGYQVALVTDGRMSGASGKVPAAIHMTPESLAGGALARVQSGDLIRMDLMKATLNLLVDEQELADRTITYPDLSENQSGCGRELFSTLRQQVGGAEQGACSFGMETDA